MKMKKTRILDTIIKFVGLLFFLTLFISPTIAEPSVTLSMSRDLGIGVGKWVSGKFTIRVTGNDEIESIELYFNSVKIDESTINSLEFTFHTKNYEKGEVNITAVGYDVDGTPYLATKDVVFISQVISIIITATVIAMVVGIYGFRFYRRKKHKTRTQPEKGQMPEIIIKREE